MSPCVLTREWFRLLYISITIMLLSLLNKLIILGTEVEEGVFPYVLPSTSSHSHNLFALCLLLIKVNNIKKEKKEKDLS